MSFNQNDITDRELEILRLVATGASNKEIATRLSISLNTVKVHLRNLYSKINVASRTEAALFAVSNGLVQPHDAVTVATDETLTFGPDELKTPEGGGETSATNTKKDRRISFFPFGLMVLIISGLLLFIVISNYQLQNSRAQLDILANQPSRWQTLAQMATPRSALALTVFEGTIFAIGGITPDGVTNVVEEYNPDTNTWSARSPKHVAVGDIKGVTVGGKIFVPGGTLETGIPTNILEIYDPELDIWTDGAPLPVPISRYALTAYEGKLYLFGGWDGAKFLNSVLIYYPEEDLWDTMTPMPTSRAYASAVASGERIFVIGGFNGEEVLDINEVYSPAKDGEAESPWSKGQALPEPRYGIGGTSIGGIIFLLGGTPESSTSSTLLFELIPQNNNWEVIKSPIEESWLDLGLVNMDTKIYVIGGSIDGVLTNRGISYQAIYTTSLPLVR